MKEVSKLEKVCRPIIKRLVEKYINETGLMPTPVDREKMQTTTGSSKPVKIGNIEVIFQDSIIVIKEGISSVQITLQEASKLAEYLYRVSGKV